MSRGKGFEALLPPGTKIGVVAPGFAVRARALRAGITWLRAAGFEVVVGRHVLSRRGYLAGSDEERSADLAEMIENPAVRAIWFARGGYGAARIAPHVPWNRLRRDPKPLLGYSDATAIFAPAIDRAGVVCIYGPVVTELGDPRAWHAASLRAALSGRPYAIPFPRRSVVASGTAEGQLVGGNLSVLSHLCGTPYLPSGRDRLLLIEDVGEPVYRVDRMLTQLRQAGLFRGVAGVIVGSMVTPPRRRFPPDRERDAVLAEALGELGVPVVRDLPVGHVPDKRALVLGRHVRLETDRGRLRIEA